MSHANNPLRYTDPDGRNVVRVLVEVGIGLAGAAETLISSAATYAAVTVIAASTAHGTAQAVKATSENTQHTMAVSFFSATAAAVIRRPIPIRTDDKTKDDVSDDDLPKGEIVPRPQEPEHEIPEARIVPKPWWPPKWWPKWLPGGGKANYCETGPGSSGRILDPVNGPVFDPAEKHLDQQVPGVSGTGRRPAPADGNGDGTVTDEEESEWMRHVR
jgi:hypothetical protein